MTQEQQNKIDELKEKISSLNIEINKFEAEINDIVAEAGGNFEDSYVVFYHGDEFIFMKVEKQVLTQHHNIQLQGPALRMPANPLLDDEDIYDGTDSGAYDEWDNLFINTRTLLGMTTQTIEKITKEQMETVLDFYFRNVKENLL